jgi:hypothetical protein
MALETLADRPTLREMRLNVRAGRGSRLAPPLVHDSFLKQPALPWIITQVEPVQILMGATAFTDL